MDSDRAKDEGVGGVGVADDFDPGGTCDSFTVVRDED